MNDRQLIPPPIGDDRSGGDLDRDFLRRAVNDRRTACQEGAEKKKKD